MATTRVTRSTRLNSNRAPGGNRENELQNKAKLVRTASFVPPRAALGASRAALGNISNKTGLAAVGNKKVVTKETEANGKHKRIVKPKTAAVENIPPEINAVPAEVTCENAPAAPSLPTSIAAEVVEVPEAAPPPPPEAPEQAEIPALNPTADSSDPMAMDISASSNRDAVDVDLAFSTRYMSVEDIDRDDAQNPQLVSIYAGDIYDYLRQTELNYPIRQKYLEGQALTGWMRAILVDWLVQVHMRFRLLQETLYLTVAIIDRYLQISPVTKDKLQLVGVTAMWIACKYEEVYVPEVSDFAYITDNAYTKPEIRQMECAILKVLKFELGRPLPLHFLRRNSKAADADATMHTLAKYLMELSLIDYELVHVLPSEIAAGALCLAMKLLSTDTAPLPWTNTLVYHSKYTDVQLKPVMLHMARLALSASTGKCTAVSGKYRSSKLMRIATIPQVGNENVQRLIGSSAL